eukprot:363303-Chlamydomonas_euryale.AAC.11
MSLECHQAAAAAAGDAAAGLLLECGRPCHKQLPGCQHPCREPCHAGRCPGMEACGEEVTVRCACKRRKAKWRCADVQRALLDAGGGSAYDAATAPRVLPCDAGCRATERPQAPDATGAANGAPAGSAVDRAARESSAASRAEAVAAAAAAEGSAGAVRKGKLSRAEREALAAAEAEQREAARRRRLVRARGIAAAVWSVLALAGLLLAWLGWRALVWLDAAAQAPAR